MPPGEWFEDQEFWTTFASTMFYEERWAEVPAVVDGIEKLVALAPGASVLDACCGPGRHSLEFAARGYHVTGVDLTEAYLAAARESAAGVPNLRFIRADMRDFHEPGAYDLALNLFTSFGYFAEPEDDLAVLRRIRSCLKPGGALVLETIGKETAVRDYTDGEVFERAGWTVQTEYSIVGAWEQLANRWILSRNGCRAADRSFSLRLYAATELRAALLASGFASVSMFGDFDGAPYDHAARSLVAVARA